MTVQMRPIETKSLRLREAEHRFANLLQILGSYVRLEMRKDRGDETREVLSRLSETIGVLAELQTEISRSGETDLAASLEQCGARLEKLGCGRIRIVVAADPVETLTEHQVTAATLIATELVMNAMKHGYPDGRSGTIRVLFERMGPTCVTLTVADDGVGVDDPRPQDQAADVHLGAGLVEGLVSALDGTIDRTSQPGEGYVASVAWSA